MIFIIFWVQLKNIRMLKTSKVFGFMDFTLYKIMTKKN